MTSAIFIFTCTIICTLCLICCHPANSQDTACSHITDEDTTITVTPILYDNEYYVQCAVASKYEYHSDLDDATTALFSSTAVEIENEIESHLSAISSSPYDVVAIRFNHVSDVAATLTSTLPPGVTLVADLIVSTSQNVSMVTVQDALQVASSPPDGSVLYYILVEPTTVRICLREVIHTSRGSLTFPVTDAGSSAGTTETCPVGFEKAGEFPIATRTCEIHPGDAPLTTFVCTNCGSITEEGELLYLSEQITSGEEEENLEVVETAVDLFSGIEENTDVSILAVAWLFEALAKTPNISIEILSRAVTLLDLALDIDVAVIIEAQRQYNTSSRINVALFQLLTITDLSGRPNVSISMTNIVLGIQRLNAVNFDWYGASVFTNEGSYGDGGSRAEFYERPELTYEQDSQASLYFQFADLPSTVAESDVRLLYVFHPTDKLFQSTEQAMAAPVGWVMSVDLAGVEGQKTGTITTTSREIIESGGESECGSFAGGLSGWSHDSCLMVERLASDQTVCQCEMLGTFAIVQVLAEPLAPPVHPILYVGGGVAFVGALLCFLVFIGIRRLRRNQLYTIQASLCLAAACFYLVFTVGQTAPSMSTGCAVVAAILHYFMLVTASSMICVAAKYFDTSRRKAAESKWFAFNAILMAWSIPLIIVCITLAPDTTIYHNSIPRCFLDSDRPYALIFALLLPIIACLIATASILVVTNCHIVRQAKDTDAVANQNGAKAPWAWLTTSRITHTTLLVILCYISWLFVLSVAYSPSQGLQWVCGISSIVLGLAFPVVLCVLDRDAKLAIMAVFGKGEQSTRSFEPYFSASQWHPNPDIVPTDAPKKFLDNSQGNSTLTRQSFNPNNLPISDIELQRIGEGNGHVNTAADVDIEMMRIGEGNGHVNVAADIESEVEEKEEDSV